MSKLLVSGGLVMAGLVAVAGPAQAYWYPTPYYYGYRPRPVFYGPRYVPVVPYYQPRVVYAPPVYLRAPAYVAPAYPPVYPVSVYAAPIRPAPVLRRPVRAVARPAPAAPPCACTTSEASPFSGPGRVDAANSRATPVATLPAPLPTLGAPTLPSPAQPRAQDIPEFPAFRTD